VEAATNKAGKRLLPQGGARNSKARTSLHLTEAQCRTLIGASEAAMAMGRPFNRFITGAWQRGGIAPQDSVAATGAFISLAREWMRERGHPMPWVWVQEVGRKRLAHCHILLHVPPELDPLFRGKPREWARKVIGGGYVSGVIDSRRFQFHRSIAHFAEAYHAELMGRLHYMLKCAPAALQGPLGLIGAGVVEWGRSDLVCGKRAAAWQGWGRGGSAFCKKPHEGKLQTDFQSKFPNDLV